MFKKINFRVILQHSEEGVKHVSRLLRKHGIKIICLKETEILRDVDNSKVSDVYVLCCSGRAWRYNLYKKKYDYKEQIYEGYKTLY